MKNQKGFSAVEALLILIIIGLLSVIGWHVWDSNKKTNGSAKIAESKPLNGNPSEWSWYEKKGAGFKFSYPKNWKITELSPYTATNGVSAIASLNIEAQGAKNDNYGLHIDVYPKGANIKDIDASEGDYKISSLTTGDKKEATLVGTINPNSNPSKLLTSAYASSCWPRACDIKLKNDSTVYVSVSGGINGEEKNGMYTITHGMDKNNQDFKTAVDILKTLTSI